MWEIPVLLLIYLLLNYFQKKAIQRTAEHGHEIQTVDELKEEKNQNILFQHADEMLSKVTVERTKAEQIEKEWLKVTKERGKVPILEYQTLRENRVEMVNTLVPENLIPYLKENKVIDQDDVEKIEKKCKDLRRKGSETMLNIVYNSGKWAFKIFIEVLQQTGYQELAQKLTDDLEKKRTDPSCAINTKKPRGRLSGIEFEVLKDNHQRLVDELDSSVLKNHLFQYDLIDEDDLERITKNEEELRREGAEEMITIIYNSGQNVLPKLLKSLDEAGYRELSSKLRFDFDQKKDMVAFPNYPVEPEMVDKGSNSLSDWKQKLTKWRKGDVSKLWCKTMNKWFKNHRYKNKDELKMVVEHWLCKLREVVDRGCLEIDEINLILNVTEKCQGTDSNTSLLQYINGMFGSKITQENFETESKNLKAQKKRLHEQYPRVFEKLKHNLEGIIAGEQNFELLPIDTESCKLADLFQSVVYDVREIWNKLH